MELELAAAQQELGEVAKQEESLKSEENEFWRRYDALWLDLYVRCYSFWQNYLHISGKKQRSCTTNRKMLRLTT